MFTLIILNSIILRQFHLKTISGKMCKRGPKLTVVRHIPNHPTTFSRNLECEMIFASFRPFRVRLSVVKVIGLVLELVLSLVKCFMFNMLKKIGGCLH